MRVLLDNCVDHRFARLITGHDVVHARQMGWAELANGELIRVAEAEGFPVMVTTDKNMRHQQNLSTNSICVIVLGSARLTYAHLAPLAEQVLLALENPQPGEFVLIEA